MISLSGSSAGRSILLHQVQWSDPLRRFSLPALLRLTLVGYNLKEGLPSGKHQCPGSALDRRGRFRPIGWYSRRCQCVSSAQQICPFPRSDLFRHHTCLVRFVRRGSSAGFPGKQRFQMWCPLDIFPPNRNSSSSLPGRPRTDTYGFQRCLNRSR